ncbi:MAG: hypothetical protein HY820_29725 [Acidobacteria bacterium]|nr:hypothetical protein [Acidobacteriota bacterium]
MTRYQNQARPSFARHDCPTALVIAASEADRNIVTAALDGLRCHTHFANSTLEAEAALANVPVAVVIVDGDKTALWWRELLERISAPEAAPAPKFIVVSRLADDRMWAEVINLCGYDLLPKPLDADEVEHVVGAALSEWRGARDSLSPVDLKEQSAWNGY